MAEHNDSTSRVPDPYRIFFPLGILMGLVGVSIWPIYAMGWIETVTSIWHIDLQVQGFLFAFILGFLLTALPRFSLTWHATRVELGWFVFVFLIGNIATLLGYFLIGRVAFALNLTSLFVFALRRFRKRKSDPPPEFIFVGIALVLGWLASLLRTMSLTGFWPGLSEIVGRHLLSEGMVLMLVLGIGGKLTPMFSGFATGSPVSQIGHLSGFTRKHTIYLTLAIGLCVSFILEHFVHEKGGLYLRAAVATAIFLFTMKIHKKPETRGVLVTLLRISNWVVCLSLWGAAIHPRFRVEVLHVLFIGGFGMMILTIATRVILSHGNYPMELEKKSVSLAASGTLLLLALGFRSTATLFPEHYFQFLGAAGILWTIGLVWWGLIFGSRAIRIRPQLENHTMI